MTVADPWNRLRYTTMVVLDWLDDHVLRHCLDQFCCWLHLYPWWQAFCGDGCTPNPAGFCVRCGWLVEVPRG